MREQIMDEQPTETLHLYVVREDQKPPKQDIPAIIMITLCSIFLIGILALSILTPAPDHSVSFNLSIQDFTLSPVMKFQKVIVIATGKGHIDATTATGTITFYNGAIYTQIIPTGTILKGADGISVITDEQAVIPPAAQTTPPTYGHTSVSSHALTPGASGNIQAGDINQACCVTSVIAQNPYGFTGGTNASDFTYLTKQDVLNTLSPLLPALQADTLSLFPSSPALNPTCTTATATTPGVGKETMSATLTITETCKAFSYSIASVREAVSLYSRHFGTGTLTHVQFSIVGIKGVVISLYVVAQWNPIVVCHIFSVGK